MYSQHYAGIHVKRSERAQGRDPRAISYFAPVVSVALSPYLSRQTLSNTPTALLWFSWMRDSARFSALFVQFPLLPHSTFRSGRYPGVGEERIRVSLVDRKEGFEGEASDDKRNRGPCLSPKAGGECPLRAVSMFSVLECLRFRIRQRKEKQSEAFFLSFFFCHALCRVAMDFNKKPPLKNENACDVRSLFPGLSFSSASYSSSFPSALPHSPRQHVRLFPPLSCVS